MKSQRMKKRIKKLIVVDFSTEPWTKANKDRWVCESERWISPQIPLNEHVYECECVWANMWAGNCPLALNRHRKRTTRCGMFTRRWSVKWALNALYFGNGQSTSHSLCISLSFHSNHSRARTRFYLGHFLLGPDIIVCSQNAVVCGTVAK